MNKAQGQNILIELTYIFLIGDQTIWTRFEGEQAGINTRELVYKSQPRSGAQTWAVTCLCQRLVQLCFVPLGYLRLCSWLHSGGWSSAAAIRFMTGDYTCACTAAGPMQL